MPDKLNHPEEFLDDHGRCQACACTRDLTAQASEEAPKGAENRSETRMKFAESWIKRFVQVLDTELDTTTARKVMQANGRTCFLDWLDHGGPKIKPITLEDYANEAKERTDGAVEVEGNTIYFQYMAAAETGRASDEGACLCPLVETKPEGLSETYCQCSVGYVKQWFDMLFEKSVTVELLDSVLRGGPRCRFKITVPD